MNQLTDTLFLVSQTVIYLFFRTLNIALVKNRVVMLGVGNVRYLPLLIVANHQSMADPFIICGALPRVIFRRLAPIRFMVANGYMHSPLKPFLFALGCFPARREANNPRSGIDYAVKLMKSGYTLLIFPEGRRTLPNQTTPKSGVGVLAGLPGVQILPIHIHWRKRQHRFRDASVSIGRPYKAVGHSPQVIMKKIYSFAKPA